MEKIVIIGGGGHAKVLISVIKKSKKFEITGYLDNVDRGTILGINFLGTDEKLNQILKNGVKNAAIGVGQINASTKRYEISKRVNDIGFYCPTIISDNSLINEDVIIGEGTQVFDGVVINSGARIGNYNIINTKSTIEHDCIIKNGCHIAPNSTLSGGVEIGNFSMIGTGAIITQYIKIADCCLIGAGSVVIKDITEMGVYVGVPTRQLK